MNRKAELELLAHPEKWPHRGLLPLTRRGGNIIYCNKDAGIITEDDLCCVWTGNYLGECDPPKRSASEIWNSGRSINCLGYRLKPNKGERKWLKIF
jgi:hypothetical protein